MIPNRSSNSILTSVSSKAREPINKLMVNPTPHSAAVPYNAAHDISPGNWVSLSFIASQQKPNTPSCLPTIKPSAMPKGTL